MGKVQELMVGWALLSFMAPAATFLALGGVDQVELGLYIACSYNILFLLLLDFLQVEVVESNGKFGLQTHAD